MITSIFFLVRIQVYSNNIFIFTTDINYDVKIKLIFTSYNFYIKELYENLIITVFIF